MTEVLKVVISIRGDKALVGVQAQDTDPVMETLAITRQEDALQEALAAAGGLADRARQKWAASPRNPAYHRPTEPAKPTPATGAARPERAAASVAPKKEGSMHRLL